MKRLLTLWILLLATAIGAVAQSSAKIATDLNQSISLLDEDSKERAVVQYTRPLTKSDITSLGSSLKRLLGPTVALVEMKPSGLTKLASVSQVKYMSLDRPVKGTLEFANPSVYADMAFTSGWTGAGIGVAVVDSGIADHPDFKTSACGAATRLVYKENFVAGETTTTDGYGHGTHVAGIIGGNSQCAETNMTKQFRGIAPAVNLISLRALNAQGAGTDSAVIAAIDRAIALKATYNIRVLNISMGRPVRESYTLDPLCQAVERAWNAGIVVVASAGNNGRYAATKGYGMISSPGNDPFIITVGALNDKLSNSRADDVMATYSSKGPTLVDHVVKPDLVAPGNAIVSSIGMGTTLSNQLAATNSVPRSYYIQNGTGNSSFYFKLSGTSMAAPMVSGAAALLLHKTPSLTPNQVKARLMKTATKAFQRSTVSVVNGVTYTTWYDAFTVGAGYLDINAALANTDLVTTTSALSPRTQRLNGRFNLVTSISTLFGNGLVWGDGLIWGDGLVWGDTLLWGEAAILAESADSLIWGESLLNGESLVWGESIFGGRTSLTIP